MAKSAYFRTYRLLSPLVRASRAIVADEHVALAVRDPAFPPRARSIGRLCLAGSEQKASSQACQGMYADLALENAAIKDVLNRKS